MDNFDFLIGAKVLSVTEEDFRVMLKDGSIRSFKFDEDEGDCCGYNDFSNVLFISPIELARNPVIVSVEANREEEVSSCCGGERMKIAVFGESQKIMDIDSFSSSGSGWAYGACVWLTCKETNEQYDLTSW